MSICEKVGDTEVVRRARGGTLPWPGQANLLTPRSRVTRGLGLAVTDKELFPVGLTAGKGSTLEMARGGSLELALKVHREEGAQGKITVNAVNLPPNVELKQFTVNDKQTEAKVKVTIKPGAPVGPQAFHFRCNAEVQYKRGLALVDAA